MRDFCSRWGKLVICAHFSKWPSSVIGVTMEPSMN
jgi:hypothetical protein